MPQTSHTINSTHAHHAACVLFISDLHLCASRPHITTQFIEFLNHTAQNAQALYVLGDLFEYWAGDDDINDAFNQQIILGFKALAENGVQLYLMHGNRDFLMGADFCKAAGMTLLSDPTCISLFGQRVLLSHGDALCTDDVEYQNVRTQMRTSAWQTQFLGQPLAMRKAQIANLRMQSETAKAKKSAQIMDVNDAAVNQLLGEYDFPPVFIHGHTHRPAKHMITIEQQKIARWVLGDWYEQGSCLKMDAQGLCNIQL